VQGADASNEFTYAVEKLLADAGERDELGRRAKELVTKNQGAAERTVELIEPLLAANTHAA
jgi:3-deoxy-D-manno-octulosonic-acid transferase